MDPRLKYDLVFGDFEGYFGVKSRIKMIITFYIPFSIFILNKKTSFPHVCTFLTIRIVFQANINKQRPSAISTLPEFR